MAVSLLNSRSNIDVPVGYIFNGVYEEVVEYSQILVNIRAQNTTDNNYILLIEFSPDKINVVSTETTTLIFDYNKLLYITPLSRYFRLTLTALSNIQNLVIQTLYKNEIVYKAINQVSGFVFVDNLPEVQTVSGNVNITNTQFDSNIISSIPLDTNILTLPALNITNTGFTSNITSVDTSCTFLTQERPTTETYFSTSASNTGILISGSPKIIRNMSLNTLSSVIVYVYVYDLASVPTNLDTATFVFTIKDSNNVVFNPLDHHFQNGLGIRATTNYNGTISPAVNSVFVNMTLSD